MLLEVEWVGSGVVSQEKQSVSAYHKANVTGLQNFLWDKLPTWANNGSCAEDIWNNFKDIVFEGIERFVPHKILQGGSNMTGTDFFSYKPQCAAAVRP
jgi:hypothetical protein